MYTECTQLDLEKMAKVICCTVLPVSKSMYEFAEILVLSCHLSILNEDLPSEPRFPWFMHHGLIVLHHRLTS